MLKNKFSISLENIVIVLSVLIGISSGTILHSYGLRYFLLLFLVICIILSTLKTKKIYIKKCSVAYLYALFTIDIVLSIFYSSDIMNTILYAFTYVSCLILINSKLKEGSFYKIFNLLEKALIIFAISILISAIFKSLMPNLYFLTSKSMNAIMNDISNGAYAGLAGDRAEAAVLMIIGISLMWGKFIVKGEKNSKIILKLLLFYLALILTSKRTLFATSLIIPFLVWLFFTKGKRKIIISVALLLCLVGFGYIMMNVPEFNNIIVRLTKTSDYATMNGRVRLWEVSLKMFNTNPLIGTGFNTFNYFAGINGITHGGEFMNPVWSYQGHNSYIQILGELGIIGIILYIFLQISYFITCFKILKNKSKLTKDQLGFTYFSLFIIIVFLLYNLTGNCAYYLNQIFIQALVFAYVVTIYTSMKKDLGDVNE